MEIDGEIDEEEVERLEDIMKEEEGEENYEEEDD